MGTILKFDVKGNVTVFKDGVTSKYVNDNWQEILSEIREILTKDVFGENTPTFFPQVERVWVLHKNKRTLMIVDEEGATNWHEGYPLSVNEQATDIYHNASRARGQDWVGPPHIHGTAFLFEDINID